MTDQKPKPVETEDTLDWVETYGVNTEDFIPPKDNNYYYDGKEGRIKKS